MPSTPNPTFEYVSARIAEHIKKGSNQPVAANAAEQVPTMFEKSIRFRLEHVPESWASEGDNVLHASKQLGALAAIITNLHHEKTVQLFAIQAAAKIVQEHCQITYRSGHWCE